MNSDRGDYQTIEAEAETLEIARKKLRSQVPNGFILLSEKIILDGKPKSIRCVAGTIEDAFAKAEREIPSNGVILEKKELAPSGQETKLIEAHNEQDAVSIAERLVPNTYRNIKTIRALRLVSTGRKGFLWIKEKPNQYEVEIVRHSAIEMIYRTSAKLSGQIGFDIKPILEAIRTKGGAARKDNIEMLITIGKPAVQALVSLSESGDKTNRDVAISLLVDIAVDSSDELMCTAIVQNLKTAKSLIDVAIRTPMHGIRQIAVGKFLGLIEEHIEKTNRTLFEALQKRILLRGEDINNPINLSLLHSLYVVLKRCQAYRRLVQEFIDSHYFVLGPRLSMFLSTHFVTSAVEQHRISHEGDIRRLIYLLQPEHPSYSEVALAFDRDLVAFDRDLEISKQHRKALDELKSLLQRNPGLLKDEITLQGSTAVITDRSNPEAYKAEALLEKITAFPMTSPTRQLKMIEDQINNEKINITRWLEGAVKTSLLADLEQKETLECIANSNYSEKRPDFSFCESMINCLYESKMLYEACCFCDTWIDVFKDFILPQKIKAIMTRSRADFLKLAYRKSLQSFGDQRNQQYEVQGPVYLVLQNGIQECDVNFLIVGPTVEQIPLKSAAEGDNQTSLEVKPGRYTVVCEPRKPAIPPLILEGNCVPGKQYPIGVVLVKQEGFQAQPPISKLGSGFPVDTGLFGAVDIDPMHPLELRYEGKQYRLRNHLGEGSGGIVYQAIDKETGATSAFKFMTTDILGGDSQIVFGKREWETYTNLVSKQNIVGILSYSENLAFFQQGREKGKKKAITAYHMEYAEHGSLRSYIEGSQDKFPIKETINILKQISIGLESIHESKLLHRDIRPDNVLVFQSAPVYRICDFTLTRKRDFMVGQLTQVFSGEMVKAFDRFTERRTASTLFSLRRIIGSSTFYSAPEEHAGLGNIDARSDIYSVGCILYWLLVGLEPFELLLHDKYRSLYERYKMAMDRQVLRLDFQHKKALFGDLNQLESELRNAGLNLKQEHSLDIENVELDYPGLRGNSITLLKDFISKTVNPDPTKRFQSVTDMRLAIEELERAII